MEIYLNDCNVIKLSSCSVCQISIQLVNFFDNPDLLSCFSYPGQTRGSRGSPKLNKKYRIYFNVYIIFLFGKVCIFYHVLAPATIIDEADTSGGMQWAAVRTKEGLRRVPPQRAPPYKTKSAMGLSFLDFQLCHQQCDQKLKTRLHFSQICLFNQLDCQNEVCSFKFAFTEKMKI
jgi:hypothetical protein